MAIARTGYTPTAGTWAGAEYAPELYSKKVLVDFYATSVYNEVCNTDYEGEFKNQGDKINIRKTPTVAVGDYTVGGTVSYEHLTEDSTELTIDKAKYTAFRIDDIDKVQADLDLMNMYSADSAHRLRISVDTDVLGYMGISAHASNLGATAGAKSSSVDLGDITAGTLGVATAITTSNAVDKIVGCGLVLDEQDVPVEGRFMVIPSWYAALLKLGDLKRADITGDSTGVIRNGMIGMVDNTKIYVNNNLASQTDDNSKTGFSVIAGTKVATSFAAQISKTDSLQIPDSFGQYWRTLLVYGRKVVQPEALVNLFAYKG